MKILRARRTPSVLEAFENVRSLFAEFAANNNQVRLLMLLVVILVCYAVARAYIVPFAHDESQTYLRAVNAPLSDVLSLNFKDANNHPLNTWGMWVFSKLSETKFILRVPNLLAYLIYLLASLVLVCKFQSSIVTISAFIVLNLNPFLVEFFALARGYGLGSGFLLLSILLAMASIETKREVRSFVLGSTALATGTLAVMSNYTFIYFYVSLPIGLFIGRLFRLPEQGIHSPGDISPRISSLLLLVFTLWNSVLTLLTVGREMIALRRLGAFYVGGKDGFWQDTIRSIIDYSFAKTIGNAEELIGTLLEAGLGLLLVLTILFMGRLLVKKRFSRDQLAWAAMVCVFISSAIVVIGAFFFLDINYPQDRSAIFLIPLLSIAFIFVINEMSKIRNRAMMRAVSGIAVIVVLFLSVNFLHSVNFHSTTIWPYDADTERMLADLESFVNEEQREQPIRLGIDWWFEPSINFYRVTKDLGWLEPVTRNGLEGEYDYYYFHPGSLKLMEDQGVEILRQYEITGNRLGKNR